MVGCRYRGAESLCWSCDTGSAWSIQSPAILVGATSDGRGGGRSAGVGVGVVSGASSGEMYEILSFQHDPVIAVDFQVQATLWVVGIGLHLAADVGRHRSSSFGLLLGFHAGEFW